MNTFFKYQSLGNDFIVFDWYTVPIEEVELELGSSAWSQRVMHLCDRHFGVGADGILVITKENGVVRMRIFNADGYEAENCLNGLRCVALHLASRYKARGIFLVSVNNHLASCSVHHDTIVTTIPFVQYVRPHNLSFSQGILRGHSAYAGNPHFIMFQEATRRWLETYGPELSSHPDFPRGSNITFVSPMPENEATFNVITYERGCGITHACSSAAAALCMTLVEKKMLARGQEVLLLFPGGPVRGFVDNESKVVLKAQASCVFEGVVATLTSPVQRQD